MTSTLKRFIFIVFITLLSLYVSLPDPLDLNLPGQKIHISFPRPGLNLHLGKMSLVRDYNFRLGLDLAGGTEITLQTDMSKLPVTDHASALASVRDVINRRIDLFGVSEPEIRTQQSGNDYQIIVALPGLKDPQGALNLIGSTAQLNFLKAAPISTAAANIATTSGLITMPTSFIPTNLTGADLQKAEVTFDNKTAEPVVSIIFNSEGAKKFSDLTKELIGKQLAITLDNNFITAPVVQTQISDGQAIITGSFTIDSAKALAIQLNAGALPVPVKIISQQTVAPTLGNDSITKSVRAGLYGLLAVVIFLVVIYGWLGVYSSIGLFIYAAITTALYKLIPITLTVPGIAGFLLSIGMAVDGNILIFERYKEELKTKPVPVALELAFGRAWDSIRDANVTTIITGFILFNPLNWSFLPTSGPVRGFALTLILGIIVSLFTGIYVTRTLLRLFIISKYQSTLKPKRP